MAAHPSSATVGFVLLSKCKIVTDVFFGLSRHLPHTPVVVVFANIKRISFPSVIEPIKCISYIDPQLKNINWYTHTHTPTLT